MLATDFDIVVYADDILIGILEGVSVDEVIKYVSDLFSVIGLEVNPEKCKCTINDTVEFMGV